MRAVKDIIKKMAASLPQTKNKMGRPFTVCVEGNIGSGKTTFLDHFSKHDGVCVLAEPVEMWRNCNGQNLLALMYEDPIKWSFVFQSYVQLTIMQNHLKPTPYPIKIMERSIYSGRYCFVESMTRDGILTEPATTVLDRWYQWIADNQKTEIDLIVYLRTSPETVYERILKRKRPEEKAVPFEYIKSLHDIHEDWLYHKTLHKCPAPTLILNANLDRSVIETEYDKLEPQILNRTGMKAQAI